jgi:hypothetical protein
MRYLVVLAVMAVAAVLSADVQAADKATTRLVPAALQAIGASESQIITNQAAEEVRGQAIYFRFNGFFSNALYEGRVAGRGVVDYLNVYIDAYTISLQAW